jgi:hypothetical protein
MKAAILEMLGSKKALAMLLAVIIWLVGRWGIQLDADDLAKAVMPIWVYIGAQAIADHGKGKAEVEAKSALRQR